MYAPANEVVFVCVCVYWFTMSLGPSIHPSVSLSGYLYVDKIISAWQLYKILTYNDYTSHMYCQ